MHSPSDFAPNVIIVSHNSGLNSECPHGKMSHTVAKVLMVISKMIHDKIAVLIIIPPIRPRKKNAKSPETSLYMVSHCDKSLE